MAPRKNTYKQKPKAKKDRKRAASELMPEKASTAESGHPSKTAKLARGTPSQAAAKANKKPEAGKTAKPAEPAQMKKARGEQDSKKGEDDAKAAGVEALAESAKKVATKRANDDDKNVGECCQSTDTKVKTDFIDTTTGDFKDIRFMDGFVDKTMLMETIMQKKYRVVALTAPRRFGKSVNLSMLQYFWECLPDAEAMTENRKLFVGTNIEKNCPDIMEQHCGKYPIIRLNFKCTINEVTCYGRAFTILCQVVHKAYKHHAYLAISEKLDEFEKKSVEEWCGKGTFKSLAKTSIDIEEALENLAEYLFKHYNQKVIVLVDEYDCICSCAVLNIDDIEEGRELIREGPNERRKRQAADEIGEIISLCMGAIGCLVKPDQDSQYVARGVLTGISCLATMGLSAVNNVRVCKFQEDHDFIKFYGLTFDECKELLSRKAISMESKIDEVKLHYNGYSEGMLSIWSVMNYVNNKGKRRNLNYWKESGVVANLDKTLKLPAVRSAVNKLLSSISNGYEIDYLTKIKYGDIRQLRNTLCAENLDVSDVSIFFNFLLEQGYLKIEQFNLAEEKIKVAIPNLEIRSEFQQQLLRFYCEPEYKYKLDKTALIYCASLFNELTASDEKNKKELKVIKEILNEIFSNIEIEVLNEATVHHIIFTILLFSFKFKCFTEVRVGKKVMNRLDLLMLSEDLRIGVIIELKYANSAEVALTQIIEKKYFDAFTNATYNPNQLEINYFLLVGLNVSVDKEITLSVLFNCKEMEKRVNID